MAEHVGVHPSILDATANPEPLGGDKKRVHIRNAHSVDRQSVQYLAEFLRGGDSAHHEVTELCLDYFSLAQPSDDGGLNALCNVFANNTTLMKVSLVGCFKNGTIEEASQIYTAFETNRSVMDLIIYGTHNLEATEFGHCISGVLLNNTTLQRLELGQLKVEAMRALQPGLRSNRHIKILDLCFCSIDDEQVVLLVDALVGNTTMQALDLRSNFITSNGLDDITRLLVHTQLHTINLAHNVGVFDNDTATQNFAHGLSRNQFLKILIICMGTTSSHAAAIIFRTLESNITLEDLWLGELFHHQESIDQLIKSLPHIKGLKRLYLHVPGYKLCMKHASFIPALHQNTSLEDFGHLDIVLWHQHSPKYQATVVAANNILTRNIGLHRAELLLAPRQPRTLLPIASKSGIWCMAFARMKSSINNGQNNMNEDTDDTIYADGDEQDNNDASDDVNNNNGVDAAAVCYPEASAILKILQARPAILQPLLRRPEATTTTATTAASRYQSGPSTNTTYQLLNYHSRDGGTNSLEVGRAATAAASAQGSSKRRRLFLKKSSSQQIDTRLVDISPGVCDVLLLQPQQKAATTPVTAMRNSLRIKKLPPSSSMYFSKKYAPSSQRKNVSFCSKRCSVRSECLTKKYCVASTTCKV